MPVKATSRCACGNLKSERGVVCRACYDVRRAKKPLLCACGAPRRSFYAKQCRACWVVLAADQRRRRICEGCGVSFLAKKDSGSGQRKYRRFHSSECRHAHAAAQKRARAVVVAEQWKQRPCLHCERPMGVVGCQRVHVSCRPAWLQAAKLAAQGARLATYVSRATREQRTCLWCQRPFITKTKASFICENKRCRRRWQRVQTKHGLSNRTDPSLIQAYRLLGDAYFALQCKHQGAGGLAQQSDRMTVETIPALPSRGRIFQSF
jgi:hypothetical protein